MVEYLTGSTRLSWIVFNPLLFLIFLAQNVGFYGSGVLLIREAQIRWHKGWATILLLGAAYGILEEGITTEVLFNPHVSSAGGLATYGHSFGVNWINVAILVPIVHPLYSISMPILLFGLIYPNLKGTSLVSRRGIAATFVIWGVDVAASAVFVIQAGHFFAGPLLLGVCAVAIGAIVIGARLVPTGLLRPKFVVPSSSLVWFAAIAAVLPWAIFIGGPWPWSLARPHGRCSS